MPQLTIDNQSLEVPPGTTLLTAAELLGIQIPTLCHLHDCPPTTSCMVCVVADQETGRLWPACAKLAENGMAVVTDSPEVREARKAAIELLLSDHVGDCEAPCRLACPAFMDIPQMLRQLANGDVETAASIVYEHIALPGVLGRICPAPCEQVCRRSSLDSPLAICRLKRYTADMTATTAPPGPLATPHLCQQTPVAIVGTGPAGLAAAWYLLRSGYHCTLFDRNAEPGGGLLEIDQKRLPKSVLQREIETIRSLGAEFRCQCLVGKDIAMTKMTAQFAAVILASGKITPDAEALFGVKRGEHGIMVDRHTLSTIDNPNIFAGGAAIGGGRLAVRAVAQGRTMAMSVMQLLTGQPVVGTPRPFNSTMGKLTHNELSVYRRSMPEKSFDQTLPGHAWNQQDAQREAARCLHCDCRKPDHCRLRQYAQQYDARQRRYRPAARRTFEQLIQANVVLETGKCIACGICVQLTARHRERLGLTFIGRGLDLRVGVPFNETLEDGLQQTAQKCIAACPTGALAAADHTCIDPGRSSP